MFKEGISVQRLVQHIVLSLIFITQKAFASIYYLVKERKFPVDLQEVPWILNHT